MAFKELKTEAGVSLGYLQTDANERLGVHNLLHVEHSESNLSTASGTFTSGAWRDRPCNATVVNNISGASVNSPSITLPDGTYFALTMASAYYVNRHVIRIFDTTGNASKLISLVAWANAASGGSPTIAEACGTFTLSAQSVIKLQHICEVTKADNGFGLSAIAGADRSVFASLLIWKVA